MSQLEEIQLSRISVSLQSESKLKRRQILQELKSRVSESRDNEKELLSLWEIINRNLIKLLNDSVEVCRDLTIEVLEIFLRHLPVDDKNIVYVIPILTRRLGNQELVETSEEVRLNCIILLKVIVDTYKETSLCLYFDDFVTILSRTVTDNYPNVKKESCDCICRIAKILPRFFYNRSESFIKPVLSNFCHQHFKVRVAAVRTIGDILQFGNSKSMEEVSTPLAERLFDQSGAVRLAVIEVAGNWMVKLPDRYSWWYKLIPLLLTGLHDEIEEIRSKSGTLWNAAGLQYLKENEKDEKLKDKMDFLIEDPIHYPSNVKRPNLGCRVIIQQNLCKLVGGIARELGDWMADIRVRSAQLLCVLTFHVEQDITQHVEKLLPAMYRACNDEDRRVVENVELAAEYLGYFVPPDIYCQLVIPTLEESPSSGHLAVFASILRGSERKSLVHRLPEITDFLQQPHICRSKKPKYQMQILKCCDSLLKVCEEDCKNVSQNIFVILFTTFSMSEKTIEEESKNLLSHLLAIEDCQNTEEFYLSHLSPVLSSISENCCSWTIYSPEFHIFRSSLGKVEIEVVYHCFQQVIRILRETMNENSDPEIRLKHFILLSDYFQKRDEIFMNFDMIFLILRDIIVPGLIWSAGRTAEAIRTAAVCCLCALLEKKKMLLNRGGEKSGIGNQSIAGNEIDGCSEASVEVPRDTKNHFQEMFEQIIPVLVTLVDDNSRKTRLYSLRAIYCLMDYGSGLNFVTDEHINKVYPVVLKRLDDGCDDVRVVAVAALRQIWKVVPKSYDVDFNRSHIDALYTTTIVHLDDPETQFQELMLEALMDLAKVCPELFLQKLENCKGNFRNQKGLEKLMRHCQEILKNPI